MSFKKWLKGATRIRFDDRTLGNVLKNGAVAGGTVLGGGAGLLLGGLGSAAGQAVLPGSNFGDIVGAGVKGAGTAGLTQAGKGLVSGALHSGAASSVGGAPATSATSAVPSVPTHGLPLPSVPDLTHVTQKAVDPRGFLSRALDTGKSAVEWAGDHDKTAAAVLSTAGDALDGSDRRLRDAQAQSLERQNAEDDYSYNQRKARDLALEPLRQALYGSLGSQIGTNYGSVAPNPYTTGGR